LGGGENNWTQVCNGGIGMGALAIADEEPALCAAILHEALKSIPRPMEYYAPDGAGTEGVTYWDYGSRYNVLFIAALPSALGTDSGWLPFRALPRPAITSCTFPALTGSRSTSVTAGCNACPRRSICGWAGVSRSRVIPGFAGTR